MPTIKHKKEMNLPQLIEWCWKNDIKNKRFISNNPDRLNSVLVSIDGIIGTDGFISNEIEKTDIFTVEVEEEITEDTLIPKILILYENNGTGITNNRAINNLDKGLIQSIYVMNDDLTMTLIWKHGKLVD